MQRSPLVGERVKSLAVAIVLVAVAIAPVASGQEFPTKPVRMIVPFGAGTTTDIVSRVVADGLSKALGQPVVVENRAGAGGVIGTEAAAKSPPDGHTIVMGTVGTHAINAGLYPKLPYDPIRDFAAIAVVGYTPTFLVVPEALPAKNVAELVALAKSRPVSFASAGNGTSGHLAGELLKARAGVEMLHVPYKDGAQALTDVIAGQVQFMFYHPAAVLPHMKAGKLRALGVSSARRSAAAPEVPTITEQGLGEFDLVAWFALYAPASTPVAVLGRLREATQRVLASAETATKLAAQGVEKTTFGGDEVGAFARNEVAKWGELVKRSGARVD